MSPAEVEALRRAADEIWEMARQMKEQGFHLASEALKESSTRLHAMAHRESLPPSE